ncbi:MAG: hypothetical protein PHC50_03315, partial [Candidatus Cloacimonetes bacterium]|nr:hypothetical protein [Candidatus Cloacimonadota bacterium]
MMALIYQAPISKRNAHIRKEQMGTEAMTRSQSASSSVPSVFLVKSHLFLQIGSSISARVVIL